MESVEQWRNESPDRSRGVFGISVTAELSGVGPQTLRLYEQRGLITPARTSGGTRRYSHADLEILARITELVKAGVNLTGIKQILFLEQANRQLREQNAELASRLQLSHTG